MKRLSSALGMVALLILPAPALSQAQFTAKVFEEGTDRPVVSTIEYEDASGKWRPIKTTNGSGMMSAACPGAVRIRANPSALEYSLSEEKACGGMMPLPVDRRELSEIFPRNWSYTSSIDRVAFAEAYAGAVLADLKRNEAEPALSGGDLMEGYLESPGTLSRADREMARTIILNQTSAEFQRIDRDRDSVLSERELDNALDRAEPRQP